MESQDSVSLHCETDADEAAELLLHTEAQHNLASSPSVLEAVNNETSERASTDVAKGDSADSGATTDMTDRGDLDVTDWILHAATASASASASEPPPASSNTNVSVDDVAHVHDAVISATRNDNENENDSEMEAATNAQIAKATTAIGIAVEVDDSAGNQAETDSKSSEKTFAARAVQPSSSAGTESSAEKSSERRSCSTASAAANVANSAIDRQYRHSVSSESVCGIKGRPSIRLASSSEMCMRDSKEQLRSTLEQYFSASASENFRQHLLEHADVNGYVTLVKLASVEEISDALGECVEKTARLKEVLADCANVELNEAGDAARTVQRRTIILLRDLPSDTLESDLRQLCAEFRLQRCEVAHGNDWYLHFATEADARRAFDHLRDSVRTFRDLPIHARLKSKTNFASGSCGYSQSHAVSFAKHRDTFVPQRQLTVATSYQATGSQTTPTGYQSSNANCSSSTGPLTDQNGNVITKCASSEHGHANAHLAPSCDGFHSPADSSFQPVAVSVDANYQCSPGSDVYQPTCSPNGYQSACSPAGYQRSLGCTMNSGYQSVCSPNGAYQPAPPNGYYGYQSGSGQRWANKHSRPQAYNWKSGNYQASRGAFAQSALSPGFVVSAGNSPSCPVGAANANLPFTAPATFGSQPFGSQANSSNAAPFNGAPMSLSSAKRSGETRPFELCFQTSANGLVLVPIRPSSLASPNATGFPQPLPAANGFQPQPPPPPSSVNGYQQAPNAFGACPPTGCDAYPSAPPMRGNYQSHFVNGPPSDYSNYAEPPDPQSQSVGAAYQSGPAGYNQHALTGFEPGYSQSMANAGYQQPVPGCYHQPPPPPHPNSGYHQTNLGAYHASMNGAGPLGPNSSNYMPQPPAGHNDSHPTTGTYQVAAGVRVKRPPAVADAAIQTEESSSAVSRPMRAANVSTSTSKAPRRATVRVVVSVAAIMNGDATYQQQQQQQQQQQSVNASNAHSLSHSQSGLSTASAQANASMNSGYPVAGGQQVLPAGLYGQQGLSAVMYQQAVEGLSHRIIRLVSTGTNTNVSCPSTTDTIVTGTSVSVSAAIVGLSNARSSRSRSVVQEEAPDDDDVFDEPAGAGGIANASRASVSKSIGIATKNAPSRSASDGDDSASSGTDEPAKRPGEAANAETGVEQPLALALAPTGSVSAALRTSSSSEWFEVVNKKERNRSRKQLHLGNNFHNAPRRFPAPSRRTGDYRLVPTNAATHHEINEDDRDVTPTHEGQGPHDEAVHRDRDRDRDVPTYREVAGAAHRTHRDTAGQTPADGCELPRAFGTKEHAAANDLHANAHEEKRTGEFCGFSEVDYPELTHGVVPDAREKSPTPTGGNQSQNQNQTAGAGLPRSYAAAISSRPTAERLVVAPAREKEAPPGAPNASVKTPGRNQSRERRESGESGRDDPGARWHGARTAAGSGVGLIRLDKNGLFTVTASSTNDDAPAKRKSNVAVVLPLTSRAPQRPDARDSHFSSRIDERFERDREWRRERDGDERYRAREFDRDRAYRTTAGERYYAKPLTRVGARFEEHPPRDREDPYAHRYREWDSSRAPRARPDSRERRRGAPPDSDEDWFKLEERERERDRDRQPSAPFERFEPKRRDSADRDVERRACARDRSTSRDRDTSQVVTRVVTNDPVDECSAGRVRERIVSDASVTSDAYAKPRQIIDWFEVCENDMRNQNA